VVVAPAAATGVGGPAGAGVGGPAGAGAGGPAGAGAGGPAGAAADAGAGAAADAGAGAAADAGAGAAADAMAGAAVLAARTPLPGATGRGRVTGLRVGSSEVRPLTLASVPTPEGNLERSFGPPASHQWSRA